MATFVTIKATEAPPPPVLRYGNAARLAEMARYDDFVRRLAPGKVGRLVCDPSEHPPGISRRVYRAASRVGVRITTWMGETGDGRTAVYFGLAE